MTELKTVGYFDIVVSKGASYATTLTIREGGNIKPLTNYTAKAQVRSDYDSETVLLDMNTENGMITISGLVGQVVITLTKEQTKSLEFDNALYDLFLISPGGEAVRYIEGTFRVLRSVTQLGSN